ncbi:transcriptional regulator with XRE-family HTH domain [Cytobacillus horneckiae]|uniref:helix-turn-helix domain-containing protein n=1 Tax=Cytobacillus horneckiae TaxID=549687 RepID=UPI0019CFDB5D|nr:helix-turn-helix transcriptional regulator [Cytobacillus horneckiae]MBN6887774.1 helix-turn-helix transcriptional regulator [Cytobacillus horneckiae]
MKIGERIVLLRERKGWKQKDLADKVNINVSVMNRIEKGTRPLTDIEIINISNALEVSTDHLLKGEDFHTKAKEILDDPDTQVAARDGNLSDDQAVELLEWLLEREKDRKPGQKQRRK